MANELSNLKPSPGSTKARKRVGRGEGSGKGKTAGRGTKGQGARNTIHPRFEGGQMPLQRRLPKRGFNNIFAKRYTEVGLDKISAKFGKGDIKVLGNGDIDKALTIKAAKFTKSAAEKIAAAGGTAEVI